MDVLASPCEWGRKIIMPIDLVLCNEIATQQIPWNGIEDDFNGKVINLCGPHYEILTKGLAKGW